ncbi:hypothetical protein CJF32_00007233 [Rutstroemia sp. NJR-2017a WRK4]|nr:hypothetical protein CJF32_00007233 [Rutstroemia sp. NJR-2017a WRK4]
MATIVKERVQKVYDAFYLPGHWDFSHEQYVTADHFDTVHNISKESCLLATNSMLCEYIQSIPEGLASSPAAHRVSERSLVSNYSQRSNQANLTPSRRTPSRRTPSHRTPSHRTRTEKDLLPANDNYDANGTQLTQSTVQDHSDNDEIQIIVKAAAAKIRKGLKNLESARTLPQLSNDTENLYDKAKSFEENLWAQASRTGAVLKEVTWSSRFLASCFRMIRLNLGIEYRANGQPMTESKDKNDNEKRKDWQVAAEMINSIVNRLLKTWKWKAFLIYPALQSTGYYFSTSAQSARKKRENIVSSLVEILCKEVPTVSGPPVLLDPAFFLDAAPTVKIIAEKLRWESRSSFDRLAAGYKLLPEGEDREPENGRTDSTLPSRKRKADVESESAPSQTKKSSTGAFPSGSSHRYEKTPVSNPEDHQFPQDVVPSLPGPQLPIPRQEPTIDTNSTTPHINISIGALLNTADYIAGSPQSQQLSTTRNSSIQIPSGAALSGHEQDSTTDEQAEIGSSRLQTGGLEPLAEADCLPSKRRQDGSIPSPDSSLSQPSNIVTHGQEEAIRSSPLGDTDMSTVPQTESARQLIGAVEGNTLGSSSGAANEQREIEFVYSSPQKENLERHLEEPFRTPIIARFQSGLENHQQCIVAMFPRNWEQDVTFSITIDRKAGFEMIQAFDLQCLTQAQSAQGQVQQYSIVPIEKLSLLGSPFYQATMFSESYKVVVGPHCSCVSAFASGGSDDNVTLSIMVDRGWGSKLSDMFGMQRIDAGL